MAKHHTTFSHAQCLLFTLSFTIGPSHLLPKVQISMHISHKKYSMAMWHDMNHVILKTTLKQSLFKILKRIKYKFRIHACVQRPPIFYFL